MTNEQFAALLELIKAIAAREAVFAADGSTEGGYDANVRYAEQMALKAFGLLP